MDNNKCLITIKENFFKKIIRNLKNIFKKEKNVEDTKKVDANNYEFDIMNRKRKFLDSVKIEENSEIVYLKIKLENGEIRAIDLTDEQIDELQKIYDKEIEEKKNKINRLKNVA
mgnify:CR=1 FL=1